VIWARLCVTGWPRMQLLCHRRDASCRQQLLRNRHGAGPATRVINRSCAECSAREAPPLSPSRGRSPAHAASAFRFPPDFRSCRSSRCPVAAHVTFVPRAYVSRLLAGPPAGQTPPSAACMWTTPTLAEFL